MEWLLANHPTEPQCSQRGYSKAAYHGHIEVLQWLYEHYANRFWMETMQSAASGGRLAIVEFLLERRGESDAMGPSGFLAVSDGHFDVVKRLFEFCEGFEVLQGAAASGHLEMVKWLHEEHNAAITAANVIYLVILHGHLHVLQYILPFRTQHNVTWALYIAASANQFEILQCLDTQISDPDSVFYETAQGLDRWQRAGNGEYLLPLDAAARNGNLEMVQWLETHGYGEGSTCAIDTAAQRGYLDVVKYLHLSHIEGCTTNAMGNAAANGHLDVVKWLHANRTESVART